MTVMITANTAPENAVNQRAVPSRSRVMGGMLYSAIAILLHRSSATSPAGREQQMSAAPGAGNSTGSGS
jgi:hypothetical protein